MAVHSGVLAWRIPWTEEPGRLQPMGLQSQKRLSSWTHTQVKLSLAGEGSEQEPFLPHVYLLTLSLVGTARRTPENLSETQQGCYR